jgi:hypothetical protein
MGKSVRYVRDWTDCRTFPHSMDVVSINRSLNWWICRPGYREYDHIYVKYNLNANKNIIAVGTPYSILRTPDIISNRLFRPAIITITTVNRKQECERSVLTPNDSYLFISSLDFCRSINCFNISSYTCWTKIGIPQRTLLAYEQYGGVSCIEIVCYRTATGEIQEYLWSASHSRSRLVKWLAYRCSFAWTQG